VPDKKKRVNLYPFGLKHKGYNNVINGTHHPYGFQEQEEQNELGLNWLSFKWRNYDPAIARFFNIDPLAEKYAYQSAYNFSENRVIDARELEGLEAEIIFNKSSQTLLITPDKSKWKAGKVGKVLLKNSDEIVKASVDIKKDGIKTIGNGKSLKSAATELVTAKATGAVKNGLIGKGTDKSLKAAKRYAKKATSGSAKKKLAKKAVDGAVNSKTAEDAVVGTVLSATKEIAKEVKKKNN
jgi:RHS repeat-associated protein